MKLKEIPIYTWVAGVATMAWVGSFGLRALKPDSAIGPAADTLMATVVAYYAKARKDAQGGKDDLVSEVLTKSVLPFVSTAHTETPAPGSPAPYTPKPTTYNPPPYTPPRPSTPPAPKPGGLPWS